MFHKVISFLNRYTTINNPYFCRVGNVARLNYLVFNQAIDMLKRTKDGISTLKVITQLSPIHNAMLAVYPEGTAIHDMIIDFYRNTPTFLKVMDLCGKADVNNPKALRELEETLISIISKFKQVYEVENIFSCSTYAPDPIWAEYKHNLDLLAQFSIDALRKAKEDFLAGELQPLLEVIDALNEASRELNIIDSTNVLLHIFIGDYFCNKLASLRMGVGNISFTKDVKAYEKRIVSVIDNVLSRLLLYLKYSSENIHIRAKTVDVKKLMEDILQLKNLRDFAGNVNTLKNVRFEYNGDDYSLIFDPKLLTFMIKQVLINAIQHAERTDNPVVSIKLSANKNKITIRIENNGNTINPEEIPYLKAPFYKGGSVNLLRSAKTSTPGTPINYIYDPENEKDAEPTENSGLGLFIAKSIIDLMQGEMKIESAGNVAIVTFTIPKN